MSSVEPIQKSFDELLGQQILGAITALVGVPGLEIVDLLDLIFRLQILLTNGRGKLTFARDLPASCGRHERCSACRRASDARFVARYKAHDGREFIGLGNTLLAAAQQMTLEMPPEMFGVSAVEAERLIALGMDVCPK